MRRSSKAKSMNRKDCSSPVARSGEDDMFYLLVVVGRLDGVQSDFLVVGGWEKNKSEVVE